MEWIRVDLSDEDLILRLENDWKTAQSALARHWKDAAHFCRKVIKYNVIRRKMQPASATLGLGKVQQGEYPQH